MTILIALVPGLQPDFAGGLVWFAELAAFVPAAGLLVGAWAGDGRSPAPGPLHRRPIRLLIGIGAAVLLVACTPAGAAWAGLPGRGAASAVLSGLFLSGVALAPSGPEPSPRLRAAIGRASLLVLLCWCTDGAAGGWGILRPVPPWSPEVAARLLDLSPMTLLMESAGVDWMRHPAIYEAAGTDRIGPGLRSVFRGPVAGSATLLVGCATLAAHALHRRRGLQL